MCPFTTYEIAKLPISDGKRRKPKRQSFPVGNNTHRRVTITEESKTLSDGIELHLLLAAIPLHHLGFQDQLMISMERGN